MKKKLNINYICEVNYPNTSAYSIHVMKMCDNFKNNSSEVNLFVPSCLGKYSVIKKKYNLKNKINIKSIFKKPFKLNFLLRVIYTFKIFNYLSVDKNKTELFISRSIIFALIASLKKFNILLELHHDLTGLTKIFFLIFKFFGFPKNLKFILIHKNLNKILKFNKFDFICLDDAVDINDFKISKKKRSYKNTCVYVGSFHKGKGLEKILSIAKILPKINFHLYGDKKFLRKKINFKNIKVFNHIHYSKIPKILNLYNVALMPYEKEVYGRLKKVNLINYMSPLKMFDYLASSQIIVATKLQVYNHILRDKYNSILINSTDKKKWAETIEKIFKNLKVYKKISRNSYKTATKHTWQLRVEKILKFSNLIFNCSSNMTKFYNAEKE